MSTTGRPTRRYVSPRRQQSAAQTRQAILDAARALFVGTRAMSPPPSSRSPKVPACPNPPSLRRLATSGPSSNSSATSPSPATKAGRPGQAPLVHPGLDEPDPGRSLPPRSQYRATAPERRRPRRGAPQRRRRRPRTPSALADRRSRTPGRRRNHHRRPPAQRTAQGRPGPEGRRHPGSSPAPTTSTTRAGTTWSTSTTNTGSPRPSSTSSCHPTTSTPTKPGHLALSPLIVAVLPAEDGRRRRPPAGRPES